MRGLMACETMAERAPHVSCGSYPVTVGASQAPTCRVRSPSDSRHRGGARVDNRSIPGDGLPHGGQIVMPP